MAFIKTYWLGKAPLWKAFWLTGVLGSAALLVFNVFLSGIFNQFGQSTNILTNFLLIIIAPLAYLCWNCVSVWRCAESQNWKWTARILILFLATLEISLATTIFYLTTSSANYKASICISARQVKNDYTPEKLFSITLRCINKKRYQDAAEVLVIGGTYAKYDSLRVKDVSAHGYYATLLTLMSEKLSQIDKVKLNISLDAINNEQKKHTEICNLIKALGPPEYYPSYMLRHGIQSKFEREANLLVKPFDKEAAWNTVRVEFLPLCV